MSLEVLQLATLIYTSRHLMPIMPPFAMWSCILKHLLFFSFFFFSDNPGSSAVMGLFFVLFFYCQSFLFNCLLSQQQSCLLVSHVIEALILDPQAARWELLNAPRWNNAASGGNVKLNLVKFSSCVIFRTFEKTAVESNDLYLFTNLLVL